MNQEIKDKLEQACKAYIDSWPVKFTAAESSAFFAGAKAILDNPSEFGLMPILDSMDHIEESDQNWSEVVDNLKSQLTEYRQALERIMEESWSFERPHKIAKEALKQQ